MIRSFALFLLLATTHIFSHAQAQPAPDQDGLLTTCAEETVPVAWSYCVHKTPGSQSRDVLYNFHGGNQNQHDWEGPNGIRKVWKESNFDAPTVITISFGPFWLLTHPNGLPDSGLLTVVTDHIMPMLESKFLDQPIGARRLLGHSMGGWNSSTLVIFRPELFKSIAMTSPAILGISPYATRKELKAYAEKNGLKIETLNNLIDFVKQMFPDQAAWEKSAPMAAGPKLLNASSPEFYISTGEADLVYGPGGREFAEMAIKAGARVEWSKLTTDHNKIDGAAVARFLMKP